MTAAQTPPGPAPEPTPSARRKRRRPNQDRWCRPLTGRWDRLTAWLDMLFVDHGVMRLVYLNLHPVADGVWRAGQPTPGQLAAFARRGGRSVVSLRGGRSFGSLPLEIEACARHGLSFHNLVLRSRALPSREEIRAFAVFFRSVERPVLFHCKSGADRSGFAAALYLMLIAGRPVAEARRQLALRFGHVRASKTGVLDAFFDAYAAETAAAPLSLADWVETAYDPQRIIAAFLANRR